MLSTAILKRVALIFVIIFTSSLAYTADFENIPREEVIELLDDSTTYYDLFGLEPYSAVTPDKVKEIMRDLRIRYHSSRARGNPLQSPETRVDATPQEVDKLWRKINDAAKTFLSPSEKLRYDRSIARNLPSLVPWQPDLFEKSRAEHVDEKRVEAYVRMLAKKVNLYAYFERQVKKESETLRDPSFQEALRRYFNIIVESRFNEESKARPLLSVRTVLPEPWGDSLFAFYRKEFDRLPELLVWVTPDRVTQLAIHLLVIDHIDRVNKYKKYLQAIMFTMSRYGDLRPSPPIGLLFKEHFSTANIWNIFSDKVGAQIMRSSRMSLDFYRRIAQFGPLLYVEADAKQDPTFSDFVIRSRIVTSREWAQFLPDVINSGTEEMEKLVNAQPELWPMMRTFLYRSSTDMGNSRYRRGAYRKLLRTLQPVYENAAARKKLPGAADRVRWSFIRTITGLFRWVGNTCRFLFTGE